MCIRDRSTPLHAERPNVRLGEHALHDCTSQWWDGIWSVGCVQPFTHPVIVFCFCFFHLEEACWCIRASIDRPTISTTQPFAIRSISICIQFVFRADPHFDSNGRPLWFDYSYLPFHFFGPDPHAEAPSDGGCRRHGGDETDPQG